MKTANWKDVVELVGIAALVASLLFVGFQLRQDQNIAIAQIYADHDDTTLEWARAIAENKDIWTRGLKGELTKDDERAAFRALVSAYIVKEGDRYARALLISPVSPTSISLQTAHVIHKYPPMRDVWNTQWFVANHDIDPNALFRGYWEEVTAELGRLDRGEVELRVTTDLAPM